MEQNSTCSLMQCFGTRNQIIISKRNQQFKMFSFIRYEIRKLKRKIFYEKHAYFFFLLRSAHKCHREGHAPKCVVNVCKKWFRIRKKKIRHKYSLNNTHRIPSFQFNFSLSINPSIKFQFAIAIFPIDFFLNITFAFKQILS